MTQLTNDDLQAIVCELQQALDDSVFIGEVYIEDETPLIICAYVLREVLNEPGAQGVYPFYASKQWLIDKVQKFIENSVDDILATWGCSDISYESFAECCDVKDNGECHVLVSITF